MTQLLNDMDLNWLEFINDLPPAQQKGAMSLDHRFCKDGCWYGKTPADVLNEMLTNGQANWY